MTTTSGRHGRLSRADRSRISFAPSDMFGVVDSILPSAGRTSGSPALAVASGMLRRPLARAAAIIWFQPSTFAARSGQYGLGLTMMPTSGGPPELASSMAYSPVQLSVAESFATITGFRSSTGNEPCGESRPASMFPPSQAAISRAAAAESAESHPRAVSGPSPSCVRTSRGTRCAGTGRGTAAAARCASS